MTTPGGVTPPVGGRPQPNLAQGNLNYGQQQVQATTRGFGQLAGLLGQIASLLSRSTASTAVPGGAGFGPHTFGSAPGTAAQWAARAQQRQRMTQMASGRLAGMGDEQQTLGQLHDAHQDALRRMQQQQQAFANQWRNTHANEAARANMTPEQQAQSERRLSQANLQYQRRSQSHQFDVADRTRQYHESRDKLTRQRRDLEEQVRQGHTDQYQAGRAMQAARRTENRRQAAGFAMDVAGRAAGAVGRIVSSYYAKDDFEAISQFGRRMSLIDPMRSGTAGQHAQAYGQDYLRTGGLNNWATSTSDWTGGAQSVIMQTAPRYRDAALRQAGSNAFVSGFGVQAAANAQAELGTSQSFYATQMYGLSPTRMAGGKTATLTDTAMSIANRVNGGNFAGLSADDLAAQLSQSGSLSTSLQTVGQSAGWSGQTLEMMRSQLEAMRGLMNPGGGETGMSQQQAQNTITSAAGGDKEAIDALKKSGMDLGSTYSDAQNILAGKDREGHLSASASYLDAAKSSADSLTDIKNLLNKVLGPLAGVMGSIQGGGIMGAAAANPGTTTLLGGVLGPVGMAGGAAIGYGSKLLQSMGGGDAPVTSNRQNSSASGGGSGGASGNAGAVIGAAEQQLGKPYLWGGTGPDGWDCSGLMQAAYKRGAGIDLPRVSEDQARVGVEVPMDQLLPGDLLFPSEENPPHVAMYIGGGRIIEAPRTGLNVREVDMGDRFHYARRVLGGAGSAASTAKSNQDGNGAVASGTKTASFSPLNASAGYGSVEEVDALAAILGGGGQQGGQPGATAASQNSTAANSSKSGSSPSGTTDSSGAKGIARGLMAKYGFGADQWDALEWLWTKESGWNSSADNPTSTAYGIPQALEYDPKSGTGYKMTGEYADYHTNATTQIKWGLNYIKGRYGSPSKAKQFWEAHNWYAAGAYDVPGDQVAKLHQGEMVLTKAQATTMRQALMEGAPGAAGGGGGSVCLDFQPGSIVISMPSATSDGAQSAARQFVDFVSADDRIKSLMGGW